MSKMRFLVVIVVVLCTALGGAATASAAQIEPVAAGTFDGSTTPAGGFGPERLAVSEETGDVYVIDRTNDVVDVFSSTGTYLRQLSAASSAAGEFGFAAGADNDIAVDNSSGPGRGTVYVLSEGGECAGVCGVFAFSKSGSFLWQKPLSGDPCGVAVDPSGSLWTADWTGGLQKRSTAAGEEGEPLGSPLLAGTESCHFDFTSSGDIALNHWNGPVDLYDPSGSLLTHIGVVSSYGATDVAVDRHTDTIDVNIGFDVQIFDTADNLVGPASFPTDAGHHLQGVAVDGGRGRLYASDLYDNGGGESKQVDIYSYPVHWPLTVSATGAGSGTVTSFPPGIECGSSCEAEFERETPITLTATPDPHNAFAGWSGACTGTEPTCEVTIEEALSVSAEFVPVPPHALTIAIAGSGQGTVSCDGGPCAPEYDQGTTLTLTATPAAGSSFAGWSGGGCSGTGPCQLTLEADTTVTATFNVLPPVEEKTCANTPSLCPPPPPPANEYGKCVAKAVKAYRKAKRSAAHKRGSAKGQAMKAANKRKHKAIARCRAQFK